MQLFKDVAQNFYDVLTLEQDLANLDGQIRQHQQREKELEDRVRIGRSRVGEVLTVQATVGTLRAQVESRRAELGAAREAFAFLSGLPVSTPLHDTETVPENPGTLDEHLARLELRPDVKAARQRLTAAQENVAVARGAHLPSLDLVANRYLERTGSLSNVEWDVQLALTLPLYAGGGTQSRVREAASQGHPGRAQRQPGAPPGGTGNPRAPPGRGRWTAASSTRWRKRPTRRAKTTRPSGTTTAWGWSRTWTRCRR